MRAISTKIPEVKILHLEHFDDDRGTFVRHWDKALWEANGIGPFVQDNVSVSAPGVLRGLHFQYGTPQGKLLSVMAGTIFDVAVDIRPGSASFGEWVGVRLSAGDHQQIWVPPGFAHGFCVIEGPATIHYRCTSAYEPEAQGGVRWDDPDLNISWPVTAPVLSERDAVLPLLSALRSA